MGPDSSPGFVSQPGVQRWTPGFLFFGVSLNTLFAIDVGKPVDRFGTTGVLSTPKCATPKLLSASPAFCARGHTDFEATQTRVSIAKKRLVHRKGPALLLLLFIYKELEEQPKSQLPAPVAAQPADIKKKAGHFSKNGWGLPKRMRTTAFTPSPARPRRLKPLHSSQEPQWIAMGTSGYVGYTTGRFCSGKQAERHHYKARARFRSNCLGNKFLRWVD